MSYDLRLAVLETYSISRMFRKFNHKEERFNKCDSNDANNIIYFGGDMHVLNVFNFLKFLSDFETNKDIQFLYEFKSRIDKTVTSKKSYMYQQYIIMKLYNFFNLFPNTVPKSRMDPEAKEFIPQNLDNYKKYLKYKSKYIKLKKILYTYKKRM